jgi:hypothetical protein
VVGHSFSNVYMPDILRPALRDPNEFYWKYRRPTEWACSCDEFRHHGDAEMFELMLVGSHMGAIVYRVTAANVPEVLKDTVPVRLTAVEGDSVGVAREIIRRSAHLVQDEDQKSA